MTPKRPASDERDKIVERFRELLRINYVMTAARWVDRTAFKENGDFGQAHQALLKARDKAARFA
jgi:hypothetical protein